MQRCRAFIAAVAAISALTPTGAALSAEPFWIYEGLVSAFSNSTPPEGEWTNDFDTDSYRVLAPPAAAYAFAPMSTATAKSFEFGMSTEVVSGGTKDLLGTSGDARANNTLNLDPGAYAVSFDYTVGPQKKTADVEAWAWVGIESGTYKYEIHDTGWGHFSTIIQVNDWLGWISFYAVSGTNVSAGLGDTNSALSNISVVPSNPSIPLVPEPETYLVTLVGLGLVGWQLRRKSRRVTTFRLN